MRARRLPPSDPASAPPSVSLASSDGGARPQWRPGVGAKGDDVLVAWQGFRTDRNALRVARSSDAGASFGGDEPLAASPGVQRFAPRVAALPGGAHVIVWESTASGERRVRAALVP